MSRASLLASPCLPNLIGNDGLSCGLMFLGGMEIHRSTTTSVEPKCVVTAFRVSVAQSPTNRLSFSSTMLLLLEIVPFLLAVHILDVS